ncbi:TPA: hypothetical protein N0F65_004706 [Lagenidium giganteum]|uniref:Rieske domain-containing protein n=1 Tax=Lagenidium giganteum TaxID=4803 RepID=A0AAV2Z321_9STRA|nr:TPA: hypothetical protein N0F65_004706 [Lagenidium giganteum]
MDDGKAIKFDLPSTSSTQRPRRTERTKAAKNVTAFVFYCHDDQQPRGFVNRCPHALLELDMDDGDFFADGFIQCKAHGAFFDPQTGMCLRGPLQELLLEVDGDDVIYKGGLAARRPRNETEDREAHRGQRQQALAETLARRADDIHRIQQELHEKTMQRMAMYRQQQQRQQPKHQTGGNSARDTTSSKNAMD